MPLATVTAARDRRSDWSLIGVLFLALGSSSASAAEDPYKAERAQFERAYAALEAGRPPPEQSDSKELRAYPLYPYLQRARIVRALDAARGGASPADEEAREFLAFYDVEPVGADLRRAWLKSLARREQWGSFTEEYRHVIGDAVLHCQFLAARIKLGRTAELHTAVAEQWLTPQQLPAECEAPFEWLRAQGAMTEGLIDQRVRLLLENGETAFARTITRRLPAPRAAPLMQWADLLDRPENALDRLIAAPTVRVADEALFAGWSKLARNNPSAALERHERLITARALNGDHASRQALALALGLAWDRRPEALAVFEQVADGDLDDYALAWQTRAALWAGDWAAVERSIAAMSAEQRETARWRYWSARAAERRGNTEAARALYASVIASDNYYAANAAARLGQRAEPHPERLPQDSTQSLALASRPGFVRARELLLCDLPTEATREWLAEYARLSEPERTAVIHLAAEWDWYDVSVATASRQNVFYDYALLYPRPYDNEVRAAARLAKLDPPLIYGVIRQESLFRADAVSPAGAMGLAQLMPDTARIVARRLNQPAPQTHELLDPAMNVRLAAAHLRNLIDRFDGQIVVALAGYNAGPLAAARWLPDRPIEADIWVENIPYNETRDYVQRVLWHSVVFAWLPAGKGQDTKSWLVTIAPQPDDSSAAL